MACGVACAICHDYRMSSTSRPPANSGLTSAALRGAVDLGALAQARQAQQQAASGAAGGGSAGAFVVDVTAADFQKVVLEQSMTAPVVLDLWASWCAPCRQLTPVLTALAGEYAGRFLLAKVDVDAEQEIAAAFQVQSIPSVFAVVQGQPIPLFQGALPEPQVRAYIEELLRVAQEAGVSGVVAPVQGEQTTAESDSPNATDVRLDLAADAVEAGDWDAAEEQYRAILADNPADPDGRAGVALVSVQRRLEGVDPGAALANSDAEPGNVPAALVASDVEIAMGDAPAAYKRLVTAVRASSGDDRQAARARLLELFELALPDDPDVGAARRALAAALY